MITGFHTIVLENLGIVSNDLLSRGASSECSGARHRNERVTSLGRRFEIRELFGVRLQVLEEPLKLLLHRVHLFAHVKDDLDARKIHAEVARQRQDQLEPLEIWIGVETRVAFGARRLQQTLAFIQPERLRMNAILVRNGADAREFEFCGVLKRPQPTRPEKQSRSSHSGS